MSTALLLMSTALAGTPAECMTEAEGLYTSWPVRFTVGLAGEESHEELGGVSAAWSWFVEWIPNDVALYVELSHSAEDQVLHVIDCTEEQYPAFATAMSGLLAACFAGGHCP